MNEIKVIAQVKKQYACPVILEYGDIRAITQAVGTTSINRDAPGGGNNKTR